MIVAFDTETNGLYPFRGNTIFAYALCNTDGKTSVHRLECENSEKYLRDSICGNADLVKVMHNALFDLKFCFECGFPFPERQSVHDTMIMSHILRNNAPSHALDYLCWELCGYSRGLDYAVKKEAKKVEGDYSKIDVALMTEYQRADVERTMLLFQTFYPLIQKNKTYVEIYNREIDLIWTVRRMIKRGIRIDIDKTRDMLNMIDSNIPSIQKNIDSIADRKINLRSPKQLREYLYGHLGLESSRKTKKGLDSTDRESILELYEMTQHPFLDLLLKHRAYTYSRDYVQKYLDFADGNGIIHTDISTDEAVTGRQSSKNPPLQNVGKSESLSKPYSMPIRSLFVPRDGYVNYHLDYQGIEARIMVHYSGNQSLIDLVNNGGDLHAEAARIFYPKYDTYPDEHKKLLRQRAKTGNFAKIYGAGLTVMSYTLGLDIQTTIKVLSRYNDVFFGNDDSRDGTNYAKTQFGRILYFDPNKEYVERNYRIQGTAAEVLKIAMNRVDKFLQRETNDRAGILLSIHDEIIIEFPRSMLRDNKEILRGVVKLMEDFPMFKVPMKVEVKVCTSNWDNLKEVEL